MQFYEVIQFVFIEDFMHCVVVSKIPSQLYKFVQLPERLKEKKNQFRLKSNRNQITLVRRNLPAVSKLLNNIKSHHVLQCKDIGASFNMHTFVSQVTFSLSVLFFGSYCMTCKKLFLHTHVHLFQRFAFASSRSSRFPESAVNGYLRLVQ